MSSHAHWSRDEFKPETEFADWDLFFGGLDSENRLLL
jgi:hypothetical protein